MRMRERRELEKEERNKTRPDKAKQGNTTRQIEPQDKRTTRQENHEIRQPQSKTRQDKYKIIQDKHKPRQPENETTTRQGMAEGAGGGEGE
jgi:hypothetical protein